MIDTAAGVNRSDVFRGLLDIISVEISKASGLSCVVPHMTKEINGRIVRSGPMDSDNLLAYYTDRPIQIPIIAVYLYADSTTVAYSGEQSVCLLRCRIDNLMCRSTTCHDFGIAPHIPFIPSYSDTNNVSTACTTRQRFLHVVLKDTIVASTFGFQYMEPFTCCELTQCSQISRRSVFSW